MNASVNKSATVIFIFLLFGALAYTYTQRSYFSTKHPLLDQIRANFAKIDPKYGEIPLRAGNSAFTENKEVITLCLTEPGTGKEYDMNTLMYVALHELAHVTSTSVGHGTEFKEKFSDLLKRGAKLGFYNPRKPIPVSYCDIKTGSHE